MFFSHFVWDTTFVLRYFFKFVQLVYHDSSHATLHMFAACFTLSAAILLTRSSQIETYNTPQLAVDKNFLLVRRSAMQIFHNASAALILPPDFSTCQPWMLSVCCIHLPLLN